ncbi:MAG: hypothetical protein ACP5UQ_07390 [Anaerolineae bacterium]
MTADELALARRHLPETAWSLFDGMARADQRHSLRVFAALQARGETDRALLQAALLHDCAKRIGVRLWHRVARVLLKAFWPASLARLAAAPMPGRTSWRYGLWVLLHHEAIGAEMAAAAGCDPLAVTLIRRHEGRPPTADPIIERLLCALQAADDDS